MKKFNKVASVLSLAMIGLGSNAIADSSDPIKIAINEWTGQHVSAHISGSVLEAAGYEVEYVTAGAVPQFAAIAQGNLHLQPETWGNNVGEIYPKSVENGDIVVLGLTGLKPIESWMYPSYMTEQCPGLPDVNALIECSQLFAAADTFPKGRLITYPADWGTRSKDLVNNAGLPFEPIAGGSEGAMIAEMQSAYKTKAPMLVMFWEPHWVHSEMDFEWVQFPGYTADCDTNPEPGIYPDKTGDCGFKQANISKIASRDFETKLARCI
jgi:glycine betaine/proline transport system substrate-binding protein